MIEVPDNLADRFIAFFQKDPAGKYYMEQLVNFRDSNTRKARKLNSLDYLSRSTGNQEALDLVENAIKSKEAKAKN